jgi:outer membrane murein-binding lipoprotein Lpp
MFPLQPFIDEFHPSTTPSDANVGMPKSQNIPEESTSKVSSNFEAPDLEVENLRRQLQALKKQSIAALDQAKRASNRADAAKTQA